MALLKCPRCKTEITGDDPAAVATEPDGTAFDEFPCFDCVLAELGDTDDAA